MRTWVIMAAVLISSTINPDHIPSTTVSATVVVLLLVGAVMDMIDFNKP